MKKNMWSLKLNTATLALIPACIGINYIGKLIVAALRLPLWLDSIGTCLAACLAGPIAGALCGAINNIIFGVTADTVSFYYAITSIGIGTVVGILAYKGFMKTFKGAVVTGLCVAITSVIISTPINIALWGGQTGNLWGDALFTWLTSQNIHTYIASFFDELVVDIPDKIATLLIVFGIYKGLPKTFTSLYQSDNQIESLDD